MFMTKHWGSWSLGIDVRALLVGAYVSRYEIRVCVFPMITLVKSRPDDWTRAARTGAMASAVDYVKRHHGYRPTRGDSWGGHPPTHVITDEPPAECDDFSQPYQPGEPYLP